MEQKKNLPGTEVLVETKSMIDSLKAVCANAGLSNDSSEYKILTEAFLYKYLNDKFLHELRKLDEFAGVENVEASYTSMPEDRREDALLELDADTAIVRPEYLLANLFNKQNEQGFAITLDSAMTGIADDNIDIFSVRTGGGQPIKLFNGISRFIVEDGKRDSFARSLINKLAAFSFERAFDQKYDFFASVFEYLIADYNKDSGTYGEYFTPHSIATIIARILVPEDASDVTVYDPAAGTGTLVLAAAHQIGEDMCTIYTQDRSQKANEFMRLNLILNNLVHSLPNVINDDTLENPRHLNASKKGIRQFDYIVSNPPFNADFSSIRDALAGEAYATRFWAGVPNVPPKEPGKMAIYLMFLQHIIVSLKPGGKAAIVVPTGFLTVSPRSSKIAYDIRRRMIDDHLLRGVINMPSNIFATTGTNVSIVFLDSSGVYDNALLMDASKLGVKVRLDKKNQRTYLTDEEIERIVNTFNAREEVEDFSVLASYEDMEAKKYSFSAGQYFEIKIDYVDITPEEFDAELKRRMDNLVELFSEGDRLQVEIEAQLKGVRLDG